MDVPYHIGFVTDETPDIRALHERCLEQGLMTTHDGRTDQVARYTVGTESRTNDATENALETLDQVERGQLTFWTESGMALRVGFTTPENELEAQWGRASISFQTTEIDGSLHEDTVYQSRIEELVDLVGALVPLVDPEYVWSSITDGHGGYESVVPDGRPIPAHVDELPWITAVSESVAEQFGGPDRVRQTPAWRVTEFDTGHIMLVLRDHPYDPTVELTGSPDAYLLDGEDPKQEAVDGLNLADPFAALDVGEYGADVCLHRDDIARSFPNEDLRLIRVTVDEERDLRRVDTGAFVRNIVDAEAGDDADLVGQMLCDIPADATDSDLHVSALLHAAVPPAFVRLDGPDDENLVTKVMALDLNVSKVELLITLGRVAQHDDFTQEDLDSMEGAMDTLAQLDADAATQHVRENFL